MTNKNTAALARFGELYKTAWTRLSERHDEIPHFAEIAANFDKITATQQGRDLVRLFAETRSAAFRTAGDDLVATRNRAAFDEVRDWQGFCRGFVELQGTLDLWSHKNRKGDTVRTLRLRIYGQPDALDAVANNLPAGRKKMQICRTQNGVTYLYAYQSPAEVSAIITYLDGFPRNERIWQRWNSFL